MTQDKKQVQILRYLFIIAFLLAVCAVFCARLVSMQIIDRPPEQEEGGQKTYTRTETIVAARGEIYDRNGKALITNAYTRSIILDYGDLPWTAQELNELILSSIKKITETDGAETLTEVEYFPFASITGEISYKDSYLAGGEDDFRLSRMLARYEKEEDTEAAEFLSYLIDRWHLADEEGNFVYSEADTYTILCRRYDMDYRQFGPASPYVLSDRASISAISAVLELNMRGVTTKISSERVYEYPGYMSHILGRTGKIPAEEAEKYEALGYPMDAVVGISGVELSFEEYLHGTDGEITVVEDMEGNVLEKYISRQPVAGKDVYLTIDVELQIVAEDSLAYRVQKIAEDGKAAGGSMSGADADAGAVVALDPSTNGVLAIASYPTYDLSLFDEIYADIAKDEKAPLLNRALGASYAPGSTFKLCTALAALTEGQITANTTIRDRGVYSYYNDYQPHCWIYDMGGGTHGTINVVGAIEHSCNYFFFDVGREMGINTIDKYAASFGLGKNTGIELPEQLGVLAGPEYAETSGIGMWMPGDTLSASIGQSYHLFTPMQLACYLSTIVNHGTRYSAHLLYGVYDFSSGEQILAYENKVMEGGIALSESHVNTVKSGMRKVMDQYLTTQAFKDLTEVQAVGKTGTAQIGGENSDNATFVSFAPYSSTREPEIIVAGIIEHGVSGNNTAYVISDIMEKYFQGEAKIGT